MDWQAAQIGNKMSVVCAALFFHLCHSCLFQHDSNPCLRAISLTSCLPAAHFHSSLSTYHTLTSVVKENSVNPSPSISEQNPMVSRPSKFFLQ